MKIFLCLFLTATFCLSACTPLKTIKKDTSKITNNQHKVTTKAQDRSERSLYLTAQTATLDGQQALAIQLLNILVAQNSTHYTSDNIKPTLKLAELLLKTNQANEALPHLQILIQQENTKHLSPSEQKNAQLMYIRSLAATNQIDEALDSLLHLLNQYPRFELARQLQIKLLIHTNQLDLAHIAINTAITLQDNPTLRQLQADAFSRERKFKKATSSLKKMQQLNPDNDTASLLLSQLKTQQGLFEEAEKILRNLIQKQPSNLRAQHHLARLLIQQNRHQDAILIYKQMNHIIPENTDILSALGLLYYQLGQFQNSIEQFNKALKLSPDNTTYQFYLANSLEALKKNAQAKALYKKIKPGQPIWEEAQLRLASISLIDKKYSPSLRHIQNILKNSPSNSHAWVLLSTVYLVQQKYQKLLDTTQDAKVLKNIPARLQMNRAIAFEHFKRYDDIENTLKELLHNNPNHADALNFLAYTYAEQGVKLDEAKGYIQRAMALQPNDAYYLDSLAWIHYKRGEYNKAASTQQKAIQIVSDDATMFDHLGDILWRQGNKTEATKQWKRALTLKPEKPQSLRRKIKHGLQ